MKRIYVILTSLVAVFIAILTASCSSHSDELLNSDAPQDGTHTYNLHLDAAAPGFDGAQSRATTSNWTYGSVLYFRFGSVTGKATYNGSSWTFTTNSTLSNTSSAASCTAVYVENPLSTSSSSITLSMNSAVYKGTGTYTCSSGDIYVNINLSPVTARMRFKGSYGTNIELPWEKNDISYPSSISLSTLLLTTEKVSVGLTVGSSGYTAYIYGTLTNTSGNNTIYVKNVSESNDYQLYSFSGTKLPVGSSGYMTIPTSSNYGSLGWSKIGGAQSSGYENGYEYVDLGLSVYWATCNVGASKPEDYGNYYAWGETMTKTNYHWSTYKWCNGSEYTMTKYCTSSGYGIVDNKTTLELADDAAHVNLGGSWRMPTKAEQDELRTKCTWTWTKMNGIYGRKVIGPNGNFIFLPAAGYRYAEGRGSVGSEGYYRSSSLSTSESNSAYYMYFLSNEVSAYNIYRYDGQSVRAVLPKKEVGHEYVDLGLSVKWATCNVGASKPEDYGSYFAWGETTTKTTYNWSTYKWCSNGSWTGMTKYTYPDSQTDGIWYSGSTFIGDRKTTLELADDAAYKNWGGSWRMPTEAEQDELRTKCTWTWASQGGINGYKVTSDTNGNSIFLPAAGCRGSSALYNAGSGGHYWSSSLGAGYSNDVYELYFISGYVGTHFNDRYYGQSVRAVCP